MKLIKIDIIMKKIFKLLFATLFLVSCNSNTAPTIDPEIPETPETPKLGLNETVEKRVPQDNAFAFDFFKKTVEASDKPNVFVSPLSVSIALGMMWNGADSDTKTEMETALKMSGFSVDEINDYYQHVLTTLPKTDPKTTLNIANSIWYKQGFSVKEDFLNTNKKYFDAEVRELDFDKEGAVDTINEWCAEKTNDLIQKPLDRISSDAVMYLVNAIYFKGLWKKPFYEDGTHEREFITESGNIVQANMMSLTSFFYYTEDDYAQYIDLPYGDGSFSMTVILPNYKKNVSDFLSYITLDTWNERLNAMDSTQIKLNMPRFKNENRYELKNILQEMGMKKAFEDNMADFSGISEDARVFISRVVHSTFVEVNEKGTEAAAVTIIEAEATGEPFYQTFYANRPFLYVIREHTTGLILFMGKMGEVELY